jgi:hypothetical protein
MMLVAPAAPPPARPKKRIRPVLVGLGVAAIVLGVILWIVAGSRYSHAVQDLAPAPVGCETTLEFDEAGTYTFFLETKGRVGDIEGDCASIDREYEYTGDALPRVSLTLVDPEGREIDLDRVDGPSYDRAGRVGQAVRQARVEESGTYVLEVEANDPDVVVRVGKDPRQGVMPLRVGGVVLALAGVVAIVLGLVLGRTPAAPSSGPGPTPYWQPSGGPPPVAPPYAHQPTTPPFAPGRPPGPVFGPGSPAPTGQEPGRPVVPGQPLPPPSPPR